MTSGTKKSARAAQASRANGAQSRGPTSADGKRIASQNARKHGLRSAAPAQGASDKQWLQDFMDTLLSERRFDSVRDRELIERVVTASFLMRKADALFSERAADLEASPLRLQIRQSRPVALTLRQIGALAVRRFREGGSVKESHALIDQHLAARVKEPPPPSCEDILGELQRITSYERRFRGQRDRALKKLFQA